MNIATWSRPSAPSVLLQIQKAEESEMASLYDPTESYAATPKMEWMN
jgi:hypothetical protein